MDAMPQDDAAKTSHRACNPPTGEDPPTSLLTLPYEILNMIALRLVLPKDVFNRQGMRFFDLSNFSLVNRHMREVATPILFESIQFLFKEPSSSKLALEEVSKCYGVRFIKRLLITTHHKWSESVMEAFKTFLLTLRPNTVLECAMFSYRVGHKRAGIIPMIPFVSFLDLCQSQAAIRSLNVGTFLGTPSVWSDEHNLVTQNLRNLYKLILLPNRIQNISACKISKLIMGAAPTLRTLDVSFHIPDYADEIKSLLADVQVHHGLIRGVLFNNLDYGVTSYALPHLVHLTLRSATCELLEPLHRMPFNICLLESLRLEDFMGFNTFFTAFHDEVVKNKAVAKLKILECHEYVTVREGKISAKAIEDFISCCPQLVQLKLSVWEFDRLPSILHIAQTCTDLAVLSITSWVMTMGGFRYYYDVDDIKILAANCPELRQLSLELPSPRLASTRGGSNSLRIERQGYSECMKELSQLPQLHTLHIPRLRSDVDFVRDDIGIVNEHSYHSWCCAVATEIFGWTPQGTLKVIFFGGSYAEGLDEYGYLRRERMDRVSGTKSITAQEFDGSYLGVLAETGIDIDLIGGWYSTNTTRWHEIEEEHHDDQSEEEVEEDGDGVAAL